MQSDVGESFGDMVIQIIHVGVLKWRSGSGCSVPDIDAAHVRTLQLHFKPGILGSHSFSQSLWQHSFLQCSAIGGQSHLVSLPLWGSASSMVWVRSNLLIQLMFFTDGSMHCSTCSTCKPSMSVQMFLIQRERLISPSFHLRIKVWQGSMGLYHQHIGSEICMTDLLNTMHHLLISIRLYYPFVEVVLTIASR